MGRMSFSSLATETPAEGRIMVVDDNPEIRRSISKLLRHFGYSVHAVASAEEADQWLDVEEAEVCILDIQLPGMTGVEFLRWSQAKAPEMAVIMLTGVDDTEVALDCLDHGARTFLVKPIEADFLRRAVRDALAVRRLLRFHNRHASPGLPREEV